MQVAETTEPRLASIEVNLDALTAPIDDAVIVNGEVLDFAYSAMNQIDMAQDFSGASSGDGIIRFKRPSLASDQRRSLIEHWLLTKSLGDLMRGVRGSLEITHAVLQFVPGPTVAAKGTTFADLLSPHRNRASNMPFEQLFSEIDARFSSPMNFSEAYLSLQKARNCLEHRDGVVGSRDAPSGGVMILKIPRVKIFYMSGSDEIELKVGEVIHNGTDDNQIAIQLKIELREMRYGHGQRIALSSKDFNEIRFACHRFGIELKERLKMLIPQSP